MITREPIAAAEMLAATLRIGRPGVIYEGPDGRMYVWDALARRYQSLDDLTTDRTGAAIAGTATITAAQLLQGALTFTGGAGTQTLPTATLLGAALNAAQGTRFFFTVDNTAGSGTCTVAVGAGIVAAAPVITGGATLTVANSATQGIGVFLIVFSSATAAVLFRVG